MIHPDDWATILREPRIGTVMSWLVWLMFALPVMVAPIVWRYSPAGHGRRRAWSASLIAVAALVALVTTWSAWYGFEARRIQALCWRAGPDAVPRTWRRYCEEIPPQGVDGLYNSSRLFKR